MTGKTIKLTVWLFALTTLMLFGCVTTGGNGSDTLDPSMVKVLKDFPDHTFDVKAYINGMQKGGKNLLVWKDPAADFSKYQSVTINEFGSRLLPDQNRFSYSTFVNTFNSNLKNGITVNQKKSANSLKVIGEIVECNPGSGAARVLVGLGAGKAGGAIACEIYEPGKTKPSMRIYTRDTASMMGDSVTYLNHIFSQLAFRTANTVNTSVGR